MSDHPTALADGRYEITGFLGSGSMAKVYRAHDTRLNVDRAIKVLEAHLTGFDRVRTRFDQEAQAMARLGHPNVVMVHDLDLDAEQPFIVMEWVTGGSLTDRLKAGGAIAPRAACNAVLGLLDALKAAHSTGIIHRDIKPQNLLITSDGHIKVSDFGIAHVDDASHSLTKTGTVMGTLGFMSPEQQQSAKGVDGRADLFSAGATLYMALMNENPGDLHVAEARKKNIESLPEPLQSVIDTACEMRPENRYEDAAAMIAALEAARDALPPDPTDSRSLSWTAPPEESLMDDQLDARVSSQGATSSTEPGTSFDTLFNQMDAPEESEQKGTPQFQTEWTEERGQKPVMITLGILILVGVVGAIVWSLVGGAQ